SDPPAAEESAIEAIDTDDTTASSAEEEPESELDAGDAVTIDVVEDDAGYLADEDDPVDAGELVAAILEDIVADAGEIPSSPQPATAPPPVAAPRPAPQRVRQQATRAGKPPAKKPG